MASNLTVDTLTKGAVTLNTDELVDTNSTQVCKAWVNFNGTGTVAIRASYNVSSITDNGTGLYTINFTTAMSDVNYSVCATSSWEPTAPNAPGTVGPSTSGTYSTSAIRLSSGQGTATLFDSPLIMAQIFR